MKKKIMFLSLFTGHLSEYIVHKVTEPICFVHTFEFRAQAIILIYLTSSCKYACHPHQHKRSFQVTYISLWPLQKMCPAK
uniref:Uncharacterized protein n=1 Tax=Rhizophora mucronata TaxID=61149 RepID=A0A2P2Q4C8_RHIMU